MEYFKILVEYFQKVVPYFRGVGYFFISLTLCWRPLKLQETI